MLAFRDGHQDAFRVLVERNQAKVYAMVFRLIPDHSQVEDLTQEVFLRIFRTAKRYQAMARFSTWLYRISSNVALNAIRARRKVKPVALDLPDSEDGSAWQRDVQDMHAPSPQSRLDENEMAAKVAQAVAALPENQRIAITLNRYEQMSYDQIAEVLDCSTMAVKSLLSRARSNLRGSLAKYLGKEILRDYPNPD